MKIQRKDRPFYYFLVLCGLVFFYLEPSSFSALYCFLGLFLANGVRKQLARLEIDNYFYFFSSTSDMEPHLAFGEMEFIPSEKQKAEIQRMEKERLGRGKQVLFFIALVFVWFVVIPIYLNGIIEISQYRYLYMVVASTLLMTSHMLHVYALLAVLFIPLVLRLESPETTLSGYLGASFFFSMFLLGLGSHSLFALNIKPLNFLKRLWPQLALFSSLLFVFYFVVFPNPFFEKKAPENLEQARKDHKDPSLRKRSGRGQEYKSKGKGQGQNGASAGGAGDLMKELEKHLSSDQIDELKEKLGKGKFKADGKQKGKKSPREKELKLSKEKVKLPPEIEKDLEKLKSEFKARDITMKGEEDSASGNRPIPIGKDDLKRVRAMLKELKVSKRKRQTVESELEQYIKKRRQMSENAEKISDSSDDLLDMIRYALLLFLGGFIMFLFWRLYMWIEKREAKKQKAISPEKLRADYLDRLRSIQMVKRHAKKEVVETYLLLDEILISLGHNEKDFTPPFVFLDDFSKKYPGYGNAYKLITEKFCDAHYGEKKVNPEDLELFRLASREVVEGLVEGALSSKSA